MTDTSIHKNIPNEWVVGRLGDFGVCIRGVSYSPDDLRTQKDNDSIFLLRSNNIQNNSLDVTNIQIVAKNKVKPTQITQDGDIFICMSNGSKDLVGKNVLIDEKIAGYTVGAFCSIYRVQKGVVHLPFITQLFSSTEYNQQIRDALSGSAINNLKNSQIEEIEFLFPSIPEQKKIAEILGSIDDEISKTEEIILKTEELKRGLSHRFFNTKKCETKLIGDVAEVFTGGTPKTSEKSYWNGDIKWMSSGEVNLKRVKDTQKKITKVGLENSNARILPVGAVMIALAGQGKTRGKVAILETETSCNQSLAAIIVDKKYLIDEYLYYNLDFRYQELRDINGEGRSGLNLKIVKSLKILVPEIKVQKEIVEVLRAIDTKILISMDLNEKLAQLKKGLMQDLLTGKVRTI